MPSKNGIEKREMTTASRRPSLDRQHFEIVVIGGGINGVAIALECARAGKSVLIVEQNDFASGTTSRATRIIHGGLRYLEHGEIGLVRESLRERERLLHEKGHLVRPLQFLLAMPEGSGRSALEVRFGLWLYRRFAGRKALLGVSENRHRLEQLLDSGRKWSVFAYEDAQCEYPERLLSEWLVSAALLGVVVRNHTEALEVTRSGGAISGVRLRDAFTAEEFSVSCKWVINATGPWADLVCQRAGIRTDDPLIGGVRGTHILLPLFEGAPKAAIYTEALDGRPIFIIPWIGQLLVGTTEVKDHSNPSDVAPSGDEIAYLLESFRRLFPTINYGPNDIRAAFAGIRPLPFITEQSPSSVTRRHFLVDHREDSAPGMISVIGGKLTTAASLARECARAIGIKVAEPKGYGVAGLSAQSADVSNLYRHMAEFAGIPMSAVKTIAQTFGPAASQVFGLIRNDHSSSESICPHSDHLVGEAVYAAQSEHAVTLADILLRRVPVALGPCWSEECTQVAAARVGRALGWDSHRIGAERDLFEEEYGRFLVKPTSNAISARPPSR